MTTRKKGCNNPNILNPIHIIRTTPKEIAKIWAAFPLEIRKIEDQQQQNHQEKWASAISEISK